VAVAADGRTAVSGSDDDTVRVWDLAAGQVRAALPGHTGGVESVAVTMNGRTAVSGSADQTVRVWDLASGQCCATLSGHTRRVHSVAVTADGRIAVSKSEDDTVRVWHLARGQCIAVHGDRSAAAVKAWSMCDTDRSYPLQRETHFLTLRSTGDGAVVALFPGQFSTADCSPDGRLVVAGDGAGQLYILRLRGRNA
jgi:WD40 repeat protein